MKETRHFKVFATVVVEDTEEKGLSDQEVEQIIQTRLQVFEESIRGHFLFLQKYREKDSVVDVVNLDIHLHVPSKK